MRLDRDALPGRESFDHVLRETQPEIVAQRYLDFYQDVMGAAGLREAA